VNDAAKLLRALAKRLEDRAFRELAAAQEEADQRERDTAIARSIACKTVAEEVAAALREQGEEP
jgi:hypothetical protein